MKQALMVLGVAGLVLATSGTARAQGGSPTDGRNLFRMYCATCHGLDGKGGGPTAASLKKAPADLTVLQAKGQAFPGERVTHAIDGTGEAGPHGNREMPVWGQAFRYTKGTPPAELSVNRLVDYVKTIQVNK